MCLERMKRDWDRQPPGLRKPWNFKEASQCHSMCGIFAHLVARLQTKIPSTDFEAAQPDLLNNFMSAVYDPELANMLVTSAPPINLTAVSFLRRRKHLSLVFEFFWMA